MSKNILRVHCLVILALGLSACTESPQSPPGLTADRIFVGDNILTMDDKFANATAVAILNDKIIWVGDDDEAISYQGEGTELMDAGGRLLLPGFIDSHNHIRYGNEPNSVDLSDAGDLLAIREKIRDRFFNSIHS